MNAGDAREPMSAETATRSEISALGDDDLLAFWFTASKEYDRLVWGDPNSFRLKGFLVEHRVAWSRAELDHRRRKQAPATPPTTDP
jgi:hypothetical protein